jgi:Flp pilus assembly pilin Flp
MDTKQPVRNRHGWASAARRFWGDEDAISGSEYAFMLALIIMFCVGAITLLGNAKATIYTELETTLTTAVNLHL